MKSVLSSATLCLALACVGCAEIRAVKPVGKELSRHDIGKMIAGTWIGPKIGPNHSEITVAIVDGPLPIEISFKAEDTKGSMRGTITELREGSACILWVKDPEKNEFGLWRVFFATSLFDSEFQKDGKLNQLVLILPDPKVASRLVGEGKIKGLVEEGSSSLFGKLRPLKVSFDSNDVSEQNKFSEQLATKEFWALDLTWAFHRKQ